MPNKKIESYSVFKETEEARLIEGGNIPDDYSDNHVIRFYLSSIDSKGEGEYAGDNGNILSISKDNRSLYGFLNPKAYFFFRNNISFDKRKQLIQYAFFRKLALISRVLNTNNLNTENKGVKNSIFATRKFNPANSKFSIYDEFFPTKNIL